MPDRKISDLVDGGAPQATDEFVVARAGDNFKIAWSSMDAAVDRVNLTIDGNTAGVGALVSSGTLTLAGGNNITLSQNGNAITISGAAAGGAQTFLAGLANSETTYTSGTVSLSELGAITIRSTTGQQFQFSVNPQSVQPETQTFIAGISASDTLYTSGNVRFTGSQAATVRSGTGQLVVIDVPVQSVQPETQTFIAGISASDTLYTSGNVRFTGVGGGVTVSSNTGQRVDISVAAQSVQPETQTFIAGISASDTLYTSGNVRFTGSQAVTVRSGTGQLVVIDAPAQTVQTQGVLSIGVSTGGNTAGNTTVNTGSRFVIVASGNATASQATAAGASTVTISVGTQTVQTQGVLSAGVSTGGNTSGDTTVNTGSRLVFVGSNNITLSQGTAAGATTITISGPAAGGVFSGGMSTNGNTSGDTGYATQRLNLVGGNNITLSGSTNGGSMSITISAPNLGAGAFSGGVSTGGNTAGATGVTGTRMVYVATGDQTLQQTTDANGATITMSQTYLSLYDPHYAKVRVTGQAGQQAVWVQPWTVDRAYVHDVAVIPVNYTQATNSTLTVTASFHLGLYTRNASTLSLLSSGSGSISINGSGTASSNQNSGNRNITFGWTNTVPAGQYWLGFLSRTSTAGANATLSNLMISQQNSPYSGLMGVASANSVQNILGMGSFGTTTTALPDSFGFTAIRAGGSVMQRPPTVYFLSQLV